MSLYSNRRRRYYNNSIVKHLIVIQIGADLETSPSITTTCFRHTHIYEQSSSSFFKPPIVGIFLPKDKWQDYEILWLQVIYINLYVNIVEQYYTLTVTCNYSLMQTIGQLRLSLSINIFFFHHNSYKLIAILGFELFFSLFLC